MEEMLVAKVQEKMKGQVNMKRLSSPCERLVFLQLEFMRGGWDSGQRAEVRR